MIPWMRRHRALGSPSLDGIGASARYLWEPSDDTVTQVAGTPVRASQVDERIAGSVHMLQATAGNQPQYVADGGDGPSGHAYLIGDDNARFMAAAVSLAGGHRTGVYVVGLGTPGVHFSAEKSTASYFGHIQESGAGYIASGTDSSPSTESIVITSPPNDSNWHLFAFRPLATGWRFEIDGVLVTPNFTKSGVLAALNNSLIFRDGATGGGSASLAFKLLVENPTDDIDAIIHTYTQYHMGVG